MESFDFTKEYILEDERVLLRSLKAEDEAHLRVFALNEAQLWTYSLISAAGQEGLKKYMEMSFAEREKKTQYPFIVFDKAANAYAGCTRYYNINIDFQSLEIGYTWYGTAFQETGLNKHCKYLLLQFVFESLCFERVAFRADNNNVKSIAAMKSIGCVVEGVLRKDTPIPTGGRRDSIVLSILKDEWFNHVKENLKQKLKTKLQ
jgi:RimJ/RimL family protein N-acetyltransferase